MYGALALVCVPVANAGGLPGLWAVLAGANALVAVGQGVAFRRTVLHEVPAAV